jgi:hypothetical protein
MRVKIGLNRAGKSRPEAIGIQIKRAFAGAKAR